MVNFLVKAGKNYWKETTEWKNLRCLWEVAIAIKLAKQRQGVTWKHTGTSKLPADFKDKTPKEVLNMAHLGFFVQRQRLWKTLPTTYKKKDKNIAIETDNCNKTAKKRHWNKALSSKEKDKAIPTA